MVLLISNSVISKIKIRKIKNLLELIESKQKKLREETKDKIALFLNIIFFDLKLPKNSKELQEYLFNFNTGNFYFKKIVYSFYPS